MSLLLPFSERNLILTGYIGPDQPYLERQIAEQLRMPFVNVELEITNRVNLTIDEIRIYYGETHLKSIEADIIHEASLRRSTVIRVNGRTLLHSDHLVRLQATGPVVCLFAELGVILHRRHVNMGSRYHDPQERAVALAELKREWAVRGRAGVYNIDTTRIDQAEISAKIIAIWQELALLRG